MLPQNAPSDVLAFLDEAGNTGNDLAHRSQRNLFIASVVVPASRFEVLAGAVADARSILAAECGLLSGVEIHASALYFGRGELKSAPEAARLAALDAVVAGVIESRATIFWQGVSKGLWAEYSRGRVDPQRPFWNDVLSAFLRQLHRLTASLYPGGVMKVEVDQNSWFGAGKGLAPQDGDLWSSFQGGEVRGADSSQSVGLQVADVAAHTLYRANKDFDNKAFVPLRADAHAEANVARLTAAKRVFPLTSAVGEILARMSPSSPGASPAPPRRGLPRRRSS